MSTSTVKRVNFSNTLPTNQAQSKTPTSDGVDGYAERKVTSQKSQTYSLPALLNDVSKSPVLSQLSKIGSTRFDVLNLPRHFDQAWLDAAAAEIDQLKQRDNWEPLGHKGAAIYIDKLADVFQVTVPDQEGLIFYIEMLAKQPTGPALRAQAGIIAGHGYKTLPLPKDILAGIDSDPVLQHVHLLERAIKVIKLKQPPRP
jgi:hypothetical protein